MKIHRHRYRYILITAMHILKYYGYRAEQNVVIVYLFMKELFCSLRLQGRRDNVRGNCRGLFAAIMTELAT